MHNFHSIYFTILLISSIFLIKNEAFLRNSTDNDSSLEKFLKRDLSYISENSPKQDSKIDFLVGNNELKDLQKRRASGKQNTSKVITKQKPSNKKSPKVKDQAKNTSQNKKKLSKTTTTMQPLKKKHSKKKPSKKKPLPKTTTKKKSPNKKPSKKSTPKLTTKRTQKTKKPKPKPTTKVPSIFDKMKEKSIDDINKLRGKLHIHKLRVNSTLAEKAQQYVEKMVKNEAISGMFDTTVEIMFYYSPSRDYFNPLDVWAARPKDENNKDSINSFITTQYTRLICAFSQSIGCGIIQDKSTGGFYLLCGIYPRGNNYNCFKKNIPLSKNKKPKNKKS